MTDLESQVKELARQQSETNKQIKDLVVSMNKMVIYEANQDHMNEALNGFGSRLTTMEKALNELTVQQALTSQKSTTIGKWVERIGMWIVIAALAGLNLFKSGS